MNDFIILVKRILLWDFLQYLLVRLQCLYWYKVLGITVDDIEIKLNLSLSAIPHERIFWLSMSGVLRENEL